MQLWVIAGPNGAGKTTLADRWLAHRIPVVSPDALAACGGLSPMQAGRAAILEQERLLGSKASFALDTTFSGNRELNLMMRATAAGYKVNLIFVCVDSIALCLGRIHERVESGGHDVPADDVLRRFARSLDNLAAAFSVANRVFVLDNTKAKRRLLLSVDNNRVKHLSKNLPNWAKGSISAQLIQSRSRDLGR